MGHDLCVGENKAKVDKISEKLTVLSAHFVRGSKLKYSINQKHMVTRPSFAKFVSSSTANSPEELFYQLSGRAKSHSYLRGPQQDVLRAYISNEYKNERDIAFELPTGSGKTTVGLLIAEWHRRRTKSRTAFLTLTNQLAAQVIEEAKSLSIDVADLRGSKDRRSRKEEGKFLDSSAVAVTTYSNLFNVNPIICGCDLLVFDDAHGGGDVAAAMWTMRICQSEFPAFYSRLYATLQPLMTETQQASLLDVSRAQRVELVDLSLNPTTREQFVQIVNSLPDGAQPRYAWSLIRPRLNACHVYVTPDEIVVRPFIAPTYSHDPFESPTKRLYLSATLGDVEDLKRAYALERVAAIRATHKQDGRRFIFAPGLAMGEDQVWSAFGKAWSRLIPQRAVAIAPSFRTLSALIGEIRNELQHQKEITYFVAEDVEDSLAPFASTEGALLALANRYDGLDLPDDDCRLLILFESPKTTNELETNLSVAWKSGPALRWREATRLAQGMGRCTRNATDYAVILLVQESIINAVTSTHTLKLLPPSIQAEIEWGRSQMRDLRLDPDSFAEMVVGLCEDEEYRKEADELIGQIEANLPNRESEASTAIAALEVRFSKAVWTGDFTKANEVARTIADNLSGNEWAGYRSWWLYLSSLAARLGNNEPAEIDSLKRAKSTGINAGWLDHLLRLRASNSERSRADTSTLSLVVAEQIWTQMDELGWSGQRFLNFLKKLDEDIASIGNHKIFHQGLGSLCRLLGATVNLPGQDGDPDVIWRFGDDIWICFEAKSEKEVSGNGLSKKDILQAKGHVNWVRFFEANLKINPQIFAVITAPIDKLHPSAEPHKQDLFFISTSDLISWSKNVHSALLEIRARFAGHEFAAVKETFVKEICRLGVDINTTLLKIKSIAL